MNRKNAVYSPPGGKSLHYMGTDLTVLARKKQDLRKPKRYGCLMVNDDVTSFAFVERCLVQFFHKTKEEACAISRMVNDLGQAVVLGPWTFEMAEDLSMRTMDEANKVNFPFICDPVEV